MGVHEYKLTDSSSQIEAYFIAHGATLTRLFVPDREGNLADILLGCSSADAYLEPHPHFNSLVGRFANRIANASFVLDGKTYLLDRNEGTNHIHGGRRGFGACEWEVTRVGATFIVFTLVSPDGDMGYPGEMRVTVRYELEDACLTYFVQAIADAPTPINITTHHYFNLLGRQGTSIDNHVIQIAADAFLPIDRASLPTGDPLSVVNTPFDLREPVAIKNACSAVNHPQMDLVGGFDHTFILDENARPQCRVTEPESGRTLELSTTEPGVQFYTTNSLDFPGGKDGTHYRRHQGFCLEPQHFPDSPNQPQFPSSILRPGETYRSQSQFKFGTAN